MTPEQSKMARAAVGWGIRELAASAEIAVSTASRFEAGENINLKSYEAMKAALCAAGVSFLDDDGNGPGVRFKPVAAAE